MEKMEIYNSVRSVPENAKKPITGGRLKGMTDINPMWRIQALTELFGPCGIGWKYIIKEKRLEAGANDGIAAFVDIDLYYKVGDLWSEAVPGTGGASFVSKETNGMYTSDECVDGDCEVLTKTGWVKFKYYDGVTEIAQFNKDTDEITFVKPVNFIKKWSLDTYRKGNIVMTGCHRNLVETSKGDRDVILAEKLSGYTGRNYRDIKCGQYGERKALTPLQRVGIMLCCDGTKFSVQKDGSITWALSLSKQRKIDRAKKLIEEAGIKIRYEHISKRPNPKWNDYTQIRFDLDGTDYKKYASFLPFGNYEGLMEELVFWDGDYTSYVKFGSLKFFSTDYDNIKYLQTLCALSGCATNVYKTERKNEAHKPYYTLYYHSQRPRMKEIEKYGDGTEVFCVEVPTTFFLIRKDDEILVTGNCFKMALTDALSVAFKNLGGGADVYWAAGQTKYSDTAGNQATQKGGSFLNRGEVLCDKCGKPILPIKKNGEIVKTAEQLMEYTKETYGLNLCYNCMKASKNDGA